VKYRDLIDKLEAAGWYRIKSKGGSHHKYAHPSDGHTITVPASNLGRDVPLGTQKAIEKQARLK